MKEDNFESANYEKHVKTSYPFLFAKEGCWINANGDLLDMNYDMDEKYLKNCIRTLENQESNIRHFNTRKHEWKLEKMYINKMKELKAALK